MNRDIERAAESLIDSSSPSTCKLHDCSLRTMPAPQKGRIGAMKTRSSRKSRVMPYTLPDVRKYPISLGSVSHLASGDHVKRDDNEYINRVSIGKELAKDFLTVLPVTTKSTSLTEQVNETMASTAKHRTPRHKHSNAKSITRSQCANPAEPRTASPGSSEHFKHNLAEPYPMEEESLPHGVHWYHSPASNVIRRLYTPSRYSPLYDNTTLVCSTQCSLCSLVSSSLDHAKPAGGTEKGRITRMDVTHESNQPESRFVHNGHPSSPVELKRSPGDINLHLGKYVREEKMTSPKRRKYYKEVPESSVMSRDETESCPDSPSNVQDRYKDRLSPKWRSSKNSPRKRRFSDRVASYSNRLTPENRMENYKYARRSPQLTFSTGESESDSVYRDKSAGPDASYRQCVISKEVNTTVQRLLFDNEKSSSSHSPSSRSKAQFPDINTDTDSNRVEKRDTKCLPDTSNLRESCTRINIYKDSPPSLHAGTRGSKQESESDKNSGGSREGQVPKAMNPAPSFISSDSQTCCSCHKAHTFTNIYARDYYLGKRVTMKKQLEANAGARSSKWKRLDVTVCPAAPCHFRSSPNKSRMSFRRDLGSSSRESLKRKPGVKLMAYASRHTHRFRTCGCQFTQNVCGTSADNFSKENLTAGAKGDHEMYKNRCKCPNMHTCRIQQAPIYRKCSRPKIGVFDINERKSAFRKPSCQMDNAMLPDSLAVSPSKKPHVSSRSAGSVHRCKKEDGAQGDTSRLLAVASTNNSSSNLSYCSDKSTSSEKPGLFPNTAQFYFVTGTKLGAGNSCDHSHTLENFKLSKDALVDMFKNSQISGSPMKSSMPLEQNMPVIKSGIKNGQSHNFEESVLKARQIDPEIPHFPAASVNDLKARAIADRSLSCSHQGTNTLAQQQMYYSEKRVTKSLEVVPNNMYFSKQNPDAPMPLRHPPTMGGDNPDKGRLSVLEEEGCATKSEALRPFETETVDVDQCNFTTLVMPSAVKQSSNPDSGYDESLSEKANGDSSFQLSVATAVDSTRTGFSPLWFKLHMSSLDQPDTKSLSMSPLSDGSRDADHAHRSHISNDCDSEQDTLPSLSDDTFQSSSNFDTLIHQSSETPRGIQNVNSFSSIKDVTMKEIDQNLSLHELIGNNAENVSPHGLNKAAIETKAGYKWAWRLNIENETGNKGSKRKLLTTRNKLYLNESIKIARSDVVGCHPLLPASTGHKHTDDCQETASTSKMASEGSSYSAGISNVGSTAADHFMPPTPTIFHFQAKASETRIPEKDTAETATQRNSQPAGSCVLKHTPELQEAKISNALYKSACHLNTLESSRAENITDTVEDIENVWPIAVQNERKSVTHLPTVNSQTAKATSPSKLKTPLATNVAFDWLPLDEFKPEENTLGLLGKELQADQQENARINAGNRTVETKLNPCRLTVCPRETLEDALPQSITLPPSSSDEDEAPEGDSPSTRVRTSDFEMSENSTGDFSTRKGGKATFTENGTCGAQWGCNADNIHTILTNKLYQNRSKQQQSNTRFANQAKNKVFISDRSIAFSDILKRF